MLMVFWLFILGLAVGSFLNVVIYRTVNGQSPLKGRSKCTECGVKIAWQNNIPLLSFMWLRGRCAQCGAKISWQYPVVEFLTGVLFVWWYVVGWGFFRLAGSPFGWLQPLFWLGVGVALLLVVVFDVRYGIIPDVLSAVLLIWVLMYRIGLVVTGRMMKGDFYLALVTGLVLTGFFYFLYQVTKKKGFGLGDVKLAPSLGLILGWPKTLIGVWLAFVVGAVVAITLLILGKKKMKQTIVFGPFLVIGTMIALWWGDAIWNWYLIMLK